MPELYQWILLCVHSPVDVHEEVDRVGDEHDKPADKEILGDDQAPDGSADRQGTDIAPEDPGRVVFEEEIGQQGTCKADKEQCIENIPCIIRAATRSPPSSGTLACSLVLAFLLLGKRQKT